VAVSPGAADPAVAVAAHAVSSGSAPA
jgi:hypothetical protein